MNFVKSFDSSSGKLLELWGEPVEMFVFWATEGQTKHPPLSCSSGVSHGVILGSTSEFEFREIEVNN